MTDWEFVTKPGVGIYSLPSGVRPPVDVLIEVAPDDWRAAAPLAPRLATVGFHVSDANREIEFVPVPFARRRVRVRPA